MIKHIIPLLLVSLLATCQPSYAIAQNYQQLNNHSFNYVDVVAVNGNNAYQERQNLFKSVQHHTIVDVFLCLSFIFCLLWVNCALSLRYSLYGGEVVEISLLLGEYRQPLT